MTPPIHFVLVRSWRVLVAVVLSGLVVSGTAVGIAGAAAAIGRPVHRVPAQIPGDCSRDVTDDLNTWIAGKRKGSILSFPKQACFRLDGTLLIDHKRGLTIRGHGSTLRAFTEGNESRRHVKILDGGNVTISNLTVIGANPNAGLGDSAWSRSHAAQHAFTLNGVQGALLDRVQAYDVYGDFVYIGMDSKLRPSRDITVLDSTFDRNGRQGITVTGGENVLIKRTTVANVRMSVIDLEPMSDDWYAKDVRVIGCRLGPRRISTLSAASQGAVDSVTFNDNTIIGPLRVIVQAKDPNRRYSGFRFVGNTAEDVPDTGDRLMWFTKVDDVYLSDNRFLFREGSGADLMALSNVRHALVEDNNLSGVDEIFVLRDDTNVDIQARRNVT
ncbi:MAG TPA: right-handed parallel beta-helix repeat-containing protein [Actinomycetota bacterium]